MTKENVLSVLSSVAEESLRKYKAQIKGIFGSVARGDESTESDIDVLVEFKENADLFDYVGLSIFLEEKLHKRVDIVPTDTIRTENRKAILEEAVYI